ncbi:MULTISPECIES: hypothetical protein [unclassified Agarivorans]|uniref:hypothetical protein n=1 Tax=unclassified Agarivorans TaxID=2636026 RepID=UPI003D7CB5A0
MDLSSIYALIMAAIEGSETSEPVLLHVLIRLTLVFILLTIEVKFFVFLNRKLP